MRNDVVESAELAVHIEGIHGPKIDVGEPQRAGDALAGFNSAFREIDAHEVTARKLSGHWNEISAVAAANLEDSASIDRHRIHAEQRGKGGKPVRMRLREG